MSTSFKKRVSSKSSHPLGTRPSLHNAQLLVSSGVPSLDVLLGKGSSHVGVPPILDWNVHEWNTYYNNIILTTGGGLAVGTVLLIGMLFIVQDGWCNSDVIILTIEEDPFGSYSRLLLKYFLSEGVMCGHALLLASASERGEDIIKVIYIGPRNLISPRIY